MSTINAQKLIALRKTASLTAEQLAQAAKVGRATITRIENGKTTHSNAVTIARLAKALRCDPAELAKPPKPAEPDSLLQDRHRVELGMSGATQNALTLVALRYGESRETILELAPLLFDLVARESLRERSTHLEALGDYRKAILAMAGKSSHLGGRLYDDWQAEEVEHRESVSIGRSDLRGEGLLGDKDIDDSFFPAEFEDESDNPFIAHLRTRFAALEGDGKETPQIDEWPRWRSPIYNVGQEEARTVSGGDEELAQAILDGVIRISAIPANLRVSDAIVERKAWMREQVSLHAERISALLGKLNINLDF